MNIEEARELFRNKSVVLVGNSVELMNYEYADFIDSHDIVVRFGKAIEANESEKKAIGTKLDVWVTGSFRAEMIRMQPYMDMLKNIPILYVRSRIHMNKSHKKIREVKHSLDMFSDEEIISIYKEYGIKSGDHDARRFSAGLWTIKFFCEKIQTQKSLTLIGFDFFVKSTTKRRAGNSDPCSWHRPIGLGTRETHWHDQEVKIVNEFKDQGRLNWVVLSDLKPEVINDTTFGRF
jgi:hypothetical protein